MGIRDLKLENFIIILFLALIIIQVGAYLAKSIFQIQNEIKLGFAFILIAVAISVILPFMLIVKKQATLDKRDVLAVIIIGGVLLMIFVFVPKLMPELFSTSQLEMIRQSIVK